ncbi:class I SAM-dependent methyltransferase [Halosegnis sp.]|uniref:class I SAM-dependent methyltransferase n=1 Tax=Halosegnis sp. TaxID=2864959 RepID=UPI0035D40AAC
MVAENPAHSRRTRTVSADDRRAFDPELARRIQRDYGTWATVYDWFARATADIGGVRAGCVAALDLEPGDTVVEFGCGPGVNVPALRRSVGPEGRVVGIDITGPMLERAQTLVERHDWENVSLVCADATRPPVEDVDAVLATFVTTLFTDPYAVVSRWCELADRVVVATFAPRGNRTANAALWAFTRLNARLFDAPADGALAQLDERTAASRRALADHAACVETHRYVFDTVTIHAGRVDGV